MKLKVPVVIDNEYIKKVVEEIVSLNCRSRALLIAEGRKYEHSY